MHVRNRLSLALPLIALVVAAAGARAQPAQVDETSLIQKKFAINLGGFLVSSDTDLRVDGDTSTGTDVDWSKEFDTGGDSLRLRVDFTWRISPRNHLRGLWFTHSRDGSKTLTRDIVWNDNTYHVGADVEARMRFDIYELAYEYAFVHNSRTEGAVSIGVHYVGLDLELEGDATNSAGMPVTNLKEKADVQGPFPVIGLRGTWRLGDDWYLNAQGQFLVVNYSGYDGTIYDARADIQWMANDWFGLGVGYNYFNVDVDADSGADFTGELKWGYDGILGYMTFAF